MRFALCARREGFFKVVAFSREEDKIKIEGTKGVGAVVGKRDEESGGIMVPWPVLCQVEFQRHDIALAIIKIVYFSSSFQSMKRKSSRNSTLLREYSQISYYFSS